MSWPSRTVLGPLFSVVLGPAPPDETPASRTLVVLPGGQPRPRQAEGDTTRVLVQPLERGSAAAALLAAHWVRWRHPEAVLAIWCQQRLPDAAGAENHLADALAFLRRSPRSMVMLDPFPRWWEGRRPVEPPADRRGPQPVRMEESPVTCLVARAASLVALGRSCLPALSEVLERAVVYGGPLEESWTLRRAYEAMPTLDLFRDLLPQNLPFVATRPGTQPRSPAGAVGRAHTGRKEEP